MYQSINFDRFQRSFADYGCSDDFTYEGIKALFHYFEEMEKGSSKPIVIDVITICCDYSEYDSAIDAMNVYVDGEGYGDIDEKAALSWLQDKTITLVCDNGHVIIKNF